jgi:hypothetical protein
MMKVNSARLVENGSRDKDTGMMESSSMTQKMGEME